PIPRRQDDGPEGGRRVPPPAEGGAVRPDGGPERVEEPRRRPGPHEDARRPARQARRVAQADRRPVADQGPARVRGDRNQGPGDREQESGVRILITRATVRTSMIISGMVTLPAV